MPIFLHRPLRESEDVEQLVKDKLWENDQLEFKVGNNPWKDGLELAKDVASFANHLRGDFVVGISEDPRGRADNWEPMHEALVDERIRQLKDWLKSYIRPEAFSEIVKIEPVQLDQAGKTVLVMSVPASPDLVGIKRGELYGFPIRIGSQTRHLTFEEIMKRTESEVRRVYLKFVDVAKPRADSVRFGGPVLVRCGDELVSLPTQNGSHGCLDAFDEDTFTVLMNGGQVAARYSPPAMHININIGVSAAVVQGSRLTLPFEVVRAVWKDPSDPELLNIAIDGSIVWIDNVWTLGLGIG